MAGTIRIRYYDKKGNVIHEQPTTDAYEPEEIELWEEWLNDPNLEQECKFDMYEIIEDK